MNYRKRDGYVCYIFQMPGLTTEKNSYQRGISECSNNKKKMRLNIKDSSFPA